MRGVSCTYLGLLSPSRVYSAAASRLENGRERPAAGRGRSGCPAGFGRTLPQAVAEPADEHE
jgi:hypothetical protein